MKNKIIGLILIVISQLVVVNGQSVEDSPAYKKGEELFSTANKVFATNQDSAVSLILEATHQFKNAKAWDRYINSLNALTTVAHYIGKYELFESSAKKTVSESQKYLANDHPEYASALNNLNSYYYQLGNFDQALKQLNYSLEIKKKNNSDPYDLSFSYNNIGATLIEKGDYTESINYLNKAKELLSDLHVQYEDSTDITLALINCKNNIAFSLMETNQLSKSVKTYDSSLKLVKSIDGVKRAALQKERILALLNSANALIKDGRFTKAKSRIEQALTFQEDDNAVRKAYSFQLLGDIELAQKRYEKAVSNYQKAVEISQKKEATSNPPFYAKKLLGLAKAEAKLNRTDQSDAAFQKAFEALAPGFTFKDQNNFPPVEQLLSKPDVLDILEARGELLRNKYTATLEDETLLAAFESYKYGTQVLQDLRANINSEETKNEYSEKTIPIYEGAISTALEYYKKSKDSRWLHEAFKMAESNKSLSLIESFNEQLALGESGIPDSLLEQDRDLRFEISFYQRKIFEAGDNQESVKKYKDLVFELKGKQENLTHHFEANYPRYFQIKNQIEESSVVDWQKSIAENKEALVEYFVGNENVYVFVLWSSGCDYFLVEDSERVFENIEWLKKSISQLPSDKEAIQNYSTFTKASYFLYQSLFEKAITSLPPDIRSIKIIPDGPINYIPFDVLIMQEASEQEAIFSPDNLAYVLERYSINYDYSATWMLKNEGKPKRTYDLEFVAYAPEFKNASEGIAARSCTSGELYNLQCSEQEVKGIQSIIGGDIRLGSEATKQRFEGEAGAYKIIHMATHACADKSNPLFNKIFITDDYLSNSDLYNLSLNAELVVLSACETGSGKLVKGEGVLSLARGFVQAGCASSIVSRWSVDDCATSEIMQPFYAELKKGRKKDEALRLAKLNYLTNASQLESHPYFWSAFVGYGDMGVLETNSAFPRWAWVLIALGLGLLFFYFKK